MKAISVLILFFAVSISKCDYSRIDSDKKECKNERIFRILYPKLSPSPERAAMAQYFYEECMKLARKPRQIITP